MDEKKLKKLYSQIMDDMANIKNNSMQDTPEGMARQKAIIEKIDEHPEVLRVQTKRWSHYTIGMAAACYNLFYVTMRALEDWEACMLMSSGDRTTYDYIKLHWDFRERIANSWQYKRLIAKQEEALTSGEEPQYDDDDLFDKDENADEYDSIME